MAAAGRLTSVDFEIFGLVQALSEVKIENISLSGVFFRKHTQIQAKALGLVGWCLNTRHNTVQGQVQGPNAKVIEMKDWLKSKGSPQSSITKAEFTSERNIDKLDHTDFKIIRKKHKKSS